MDDGEVKTGKRVGRPQEVSNAEILAKARECFLERGAHVSATAIARELGVSHTTLFNRFGSKEGLMLAALGVPDEVPWVKDLEAGPDDRPLPEQLAGHARVIGAFFLRLHAGLAVLQAAGIPQETIMPIGDRDAAPVRAFRAFVAWLRRAQDRGLIGECDAEALASTILGALQNRGLTAKAYGRSSKADDVYVERLVDLLWKGVAPRTAVR